MNKLLKLKLYINKKNKAITMQIPRRKLPFSVRSEIDLMKKAHVRIEDFE